MDTRKGEEGQAPCVLCPIKSYVSKTKPKHICLVSIIPQIGLMLLLGLMFIINVSPKLENKFQSEHSVFEN